MSYICVRSCVSSWATDAKKSCQGFSRTGTHEVMHSSIAFREKNEEMISKCQDERCSGAYSSSPLYVPRAIHVLWGQSTGPNISCVIWVQTCSQNWEQWKQVRQINKLHNSDTLWYILTGRKASVPGPRTWFSARFGRRSGLLPNGGEQKNFEQILMFCAFLSRQKVHASSKVSKLRSLNTDYLCRRSNCTTFAMCKDCAEMSNVVRSTESTREYTST